MIYHIPIMIIHHGCCGSSLQSCNQSNFYAAVQRKKTIGVVILSVYHDYHPICIWSEPIALCTNPSAVYGYGYDYYYTNTASVIVPVFTVIYYYTVGVFYTHARPLL